MGLTGDETVEIRCILAEVIQTEPEQAQAVVRIQAALIESESDMDTVAFPIGLYLKFRDQIF